LGRTEAIIEGFGRKGKAESGGDVDTQQAVDGAPVLERNVAVDAGLGWLGNCCGLAQAAATCRKHGRCAQRGGDHMASFHGSS
jgi:hypothetical protein